jgi:hypothetical protein
MYQLRLANSLLVPKTGGEGMVKSTELDFDGELQRGEQSRDVNRGGKAAVLADPSRDHCHDGWPPERFLLSYVTSLLELNGEMVELGRRVRLRVEEAMHDHTHNRLADEDEDATSSSGLPDKNDDQTASEEAEMEVSELRV